MTDEEREEFREHLREEITRDFDNVILERLIPRVLCPECLGGRCDWNAGDPPDPCETCVGGGNIQIIRLFEGLVDANSVLILLRSLPDTAAPTGSQKLGPYPFSFTGVGCCLTVADFGVSLGQAALRCPSIGVSGAQLIKDYAKGRWPEKWEGSTWAI